MLQAPKYLKILFNESKLLNFNEYLMSKKYNTSSFNVRLKKNSNNQISSLYIKHNLKNNSHNLIGKRSFHQSLNNFNQNWFSVTFEKGNEQFNVKGKDGDTLLDVAINNNLDLEGFGVCDGTLSCSTCHVIFDKAAYASIPEKMTDEEDDMLDLAYSVTDTSLGGCITFAGCGFLCMYELGAAEFLRCAFPTVVKRARVCGASSGSLVASALICGVPTTDSCDVVLAMAELVKEADWGPFERRFRSQDPLRRGLRELLPTNAHELCSGRLFVSVTQANNLRNELHYEWESREQLIQSLLCSCYLPLMSGFKLPIMSGKKYLDGCFSDNMPMYPPQIDGKRPCISISPFAGLATICPRNDPLGLLSLKFSKEHRAMMMTRANFRRFWQSMFPVERKDLKLLAQKGFEDAAAVFRGTEVKKKINLERSAAFAMKENDKVDHNKSYNVKNKS